MKKGKQNREIVLVYGRHENGGAQRQAITLANGLSRQGYKVSLLAIKGTVGGITPEVFFDIDDDVELVFLPEFSEKHKSDPIVTKDEKQQEKKVKRYRLLRDIGSAFGPANTLSRKIKTIRIGKTVRPFLLLHQNAVFLAFGVDCYELIYCASLGLKCKTVFVEITSPQECRNCDKQRRRWLIKQADGTVFQTKDQQQWYEGYLNQNTAIIYNPILRDLPAPYTGVRKPVVANFCRMSPEKNIPLLIRAFEKLHLDYPNYTLEIYGNTVSQREQEYRLSIGDMIDQSAAREAIHLLPPSKDIHRVVLDCAMFVSSSDFEGLSNSMIEAMAIGLPCVCTDCRGGGAREVIRDGENGLLTPVGDVDSLYEGMKRFADDPELARRCGESASAIKQELSTERIVKQWLNVISEVM